jgi:hypothetical protein
MMTALPHSLHPEISCARLLHPAQLRQPWDRAGSFVILVYLTLSMPAIIVLSVVGGLNATTDAAFKREDHYGIVVKPYVSMTDTTNAASGVEARPDEVVGGWRYDVPLQFK